MMTSGLTQSMCNWVAPTGLAGIVCRFESSEKESRWARGQSSRQFKENLELSESRMHTARAMVSMGRSERTKISCTSGTDGTAKDAAGGMRFTRWTAGPGTTG